MWPNIDRRWHWTLNIAFIEGLMELMRSELREYCEQCRWIVKIHIKRVFDLSECRLPNICFTWVQHCFINNYTILFQRAKNIFNSKKSFFRIETLKNPFQVEVLFLNLYSKSNSELSSAIGWSCKHTYFHFFGSAYLSFEEWIPFLFANRCVRFS